MSDTTTTPDAPYQLGDLIPLEDLLAFPPDHRRLGRDPAGRLCVLDPESAPGHALPISELCSLLYDLLPSSHLVMTTAPLALPRLLRLDGTEVPASRLGRPRAIEADLGVFDGTPRIAHAEDDESTSFTLRRLGLVVEVLSTRTWRADLGHGEEDVVDHWTSYLHSGVPELWVVNVNVRECPLPPMNGLFLRNAGDAWVPLDVASPAHGPGAVHGLRPLMAGVVRSGLGFDLDVGALFQDLARVIARANRSEDAPPA